MWHKPFCASTHGAQTCVKFCTHICLNIDIVVRCSCGRSTWQWWHVSLSRHAPIYFGSVYFVMSSKFVKKIPSYVNKIYLKYSLLVLLTRSHNNNPTYLVYTPLVKETFSPFYYVGTWQHYMDSTLFNFLPKPNHWYRQQGNLCRYTAISQVSVIISKIKNPSIVPFVFSDQSPDQRCQGNFWNSEDPSKTVTWAFWFLELYFCKFLA
jgi:hypothetical protein